ncbi:MAG: 23S rRNA (pseudouridine(1915)-N(3))-methyltransferase RlmH [Deltaproteobacteria bacterium]
MRVAILAIGRLKDDAEASIVARYTKRFDQTGRPAGLGPLSVSELPESRAATAAERKADEASRLLKAAGPAALVVLEVSGRSMASEDFAAHFRKLADEGAKACAILIGGPDGHGPAVLETPSLKLSLGAFTLPHGLARVVIAEQLYRAATILTGHPYHRT